MLHDSPDRDPGELPRRAPRFRSPDPPFGPKVDLFPYKSTPLPTRTRRDPFPLRSPTFSERLGDHDPFPVRSAPLPDTGWLTGGRAPPVAAPQDLPGGVPPMIEPSLDGMSYSVVSQDAVPRRVRRDPFAMGRLNPDASRFVGGTWLPGPGAARAVKTLLGF